MKTPTKFEIGNRVEITGGIRRGQSGTITGETRGIGGVVLYKVDLGRFGKEAFSAALLAVVGD